MSQTIYSVGQLSPFLIDFPAVSLCMNGENLLEFRGSLLNIPLVHI